MNEKFSKPVDVIIPVFNAYSLINACLHSVIEHFDNNARLILMDDSSSDSRILPCLEECQRQAQFPVVIHRNNDNQGFVKTVNQGMQFSDDNDVILLNSDTIVTKNWIAKLRIAAYSKDNVATVTPMSNNATIFSVPEFGKVNQLPPGYDVDRFAELIETQTLGLYPEVPTGHGFCLYIKRTSLKLLGLFDESYGSGCEEENDFCMRVISHSLCNIMADDTFIYHAGRASYQDQNRNETERFNQEQLLTRYPFYLDLIRDYQTHRPRQIWDNINAQIYGLRVGIDGRCLNQTISGTQRYLLELLQAYINLKSRIKIDLLVSNGCRDHVINLLQDYHLSSLPNLLEESQLEEEVGSDGWDIFHITFQGISLQDIVGIQPYAKRVLNTWQDFILFRNPYYFTDFREFEKYRFNCQTLLESVDGIVAISNYIKQDILNEQWLDQKRIKRIYHGINEQRQSQTLEYNPVIKSGLTPQRYLLFVGNDFLHKNLEATVSVFQETFNQGYDYQLVIVGKAVDQGGVTSKLEQALDADIKERVWFLDYVSDEELISLYRHAGVLLYLSNAEGFGLPPLEAFANDCPVIASKLTSIPEVVGEAAPCFHPGEIENIASDVIRLIENLSERDRAIQTGKQQLKQFNWNQTAQETIAFYYDLLRLPPNAQRNLPSLHLNSQQLQETESQLKQTEMELNQARTQIAAMESSKFWKLRQKWLKVKSWLGLASE